ncbi:hypothetical protein DLR11_18920 [Salmonella enterica subsp. salamae]|nr:hypothetical protein [Salmonella enterica subsp. salamae]ECG1476626.1 hypothetical protein [Salmonella enterica subsp. salamae]ECI3453860.1 hypothetical protein [Salmonella enterica subsp. salamae]ECI4075077.1 hypothetical protein [Salmonella enterica subsp. salamae]MJZ02420.1 hypothetical protein [Salmonella enterica subsp. salamae]
MHGHYFSNISSTYFKLQVRWLYSFTPVTYRCKRPGINEGHLCSSPEVASGFSNSFQTNLSLRRRLPVTWIMESISIASGGLFNVG